MTGPIPPTHVRVFMQVGDGPVQETQGFDLTLNPEYATSIYRPTEDADSPLDILRAKMLVDGHPIADAFAKGLVPATAEALPSAVGA
jgi:hypothetical protein